MNDSQYQITYDQFKPDNQLDSYVKFWLYNVIEYCPYDSYFSVTISALKNRYLVDLTVRYTHDQFHGLGEETSVENALASAENSLYQQIKDWRHSRYEQNDKPAKKLKVLVVDDDPASTKIMEACLQEHGCEVHQVSSGDEAIFSFKNGEYRFVIMDWNMQPLNGRQTLKIMDSNVHVNKSALREKIPVLTYSVNNEDQISFPRTENLYQMAHLSKTSTLNKTFETTKNIINQINGYSAIH